jgi:hypothetical protein
VKSGGKQSKRLIKISGSVGKWREMEESMSVLVASPVGQNVPPVPIASHTQPSEPIGDKNRITRLALKRAVCAALGNGTGEVVKVRWAENQAVWERSRVPGS